MRIGLIGAGRIGKIHARNLAFHIPGAELVAIADVDLGAARECARACGVGEAYEDPRRVMEEQSVEAVVICSSTAHHAEQIIQAADAGKHIFCEKPIDLDLARIDAALAAVEAAGVKLQVGFNRRFDPGFRRARDLVREGRIGSPHLVRITSRDPEPPPMEYVRASGGLFLDMTIHDFDMARWIVGLEIESIFALGSVLVNPEIGEAGDVDTALLSFRYTSGALGSIDNSRRSVYGYDQRVEVFGSDGSVVVSNVLPNTCALSGTDGIRSEPPLHFFLERYEKAYLAELTAFVECLLHDRPSPVSGEDGRIPVVMARAAQRSLELGQPVRVDRLSSAS